MTKIIENTIDLFGNLIDVNRRERKYKVIIDFNVGCINSKKSEVVQKVVPPDTYVDTYDYIDRMEYKVNRVPLMELMNLVQKRTILSFSVLLNVSAK